MNFNAQVEFQRYKDEILKMIEGEDHRNVLKSWVHHKRGNGYTKQQIYEILLQFLPYTDLINDTDERLYDRMADFLDSFTVLGKSWRILPDEPDVH
jgi:hypothetical protein